MLHAHRAPHLYRILFDRSLHELEVVFLARPYIKAFVSGEPPSEVHVVFNRNSNEVMCKFLGE